MDIEISGKIWFWKGPSPFYFVTVPPEQSDYLKTLAAAVTYGWGMIPVHAHIGKTTWKTSLFPKDGGYIVPLKDSVRKAERLSEGDTITILLKVIN
ncbi:MAG: DUF1905 domain-containing protein [Anaerolineae bacterium]|nr:DUF1905 domain-containing protein [Anaerolineae bacterium]